MALSGTLRDFGIADILQLIGQQGKSGVLLLKNKEQDVSISFQEGSIVGAESVTRKKRDMIGAMLVRAEVITEAQLEFALDEQKRTLRRIGDVLIKSGAITEKRFHEMIQLQATETLYQLFGWKSGTYAFEQRDVEADANGFTPLRAESVLMEGFRMVDEWPHIKKRIDRYDLTFDRLKDPPKETLKEPEEKSEDDELDNAFGEDEPEERKGEFASLGKPERRVFELAITGRTVRRIIDVSCLGEFETCKALLNLVNLEYLKVIEPSGRQADRMDSTSLRQRLQGVAGGVLAAALLVVTMAFAAAQAGWDSFSIGGTSQGAVLDSPTQKMISRSQQSRITAALGVYRLEKGELPKSLDALVTSGLLTQDDLRYPWRDSYYYRRTTPGEFILLPPLR
jgi:hypothetical protein